MFPSRSGAQLHSLSLRVGFHWWIVRARGHREPSRKGFCGSESEAASKLGGRSPSKPWVRICARHTPDFESEAASKLGGRSLSEPWVRICARHIPD